MRGIVGAITAAALALPRTVFAHGGPNKARELGHHWEISSYIGEMRFQMILMAAITCAILIGSLVIRARRRGDAGL